MTIRDALHHSGLPRLECEILLGFVLGKPRTWIIAHDESAVPQEKVSRWEQTLERRLQGEPVAYITGTKEFYGRDFLVTPATLIPRPATEMLVEAALLMLREPMNLVSEADEGISILSLCLELQAPGLIVDVGTGSGAIAITLALEGWNGPITAVDTKQEALSIAKKNAAVFGVQKNFTFLHTDGALFITKIREPFLVVSNPPYISAGTALPKDVEEFEPHGALFAGPDGLSVIRPLLLAAKGNPACTGVVLELRTDQVTEAKRLMEE